jgi:transketolase
MPFEDIGLMRTIPRLVVVDPCDGASLRKLLPQIAAHKGSVYLRLNRKDTPVTYADDVEFSLGKAKVILEGTDIALFASGAICVPEAKAAAALLKKDGISAAVLDFHTIKPIDTEAILSWARKTGCILTCENHQIVNGLGSAVAEVLGENLPTRMGRIGVNEEFGQVGDVAYLLKAYHLDAESIRVKAKGLLGK